MSEDKLTAEERDALRRMRGFSTFTEELARIIDRLAPAPRPPEPRVSELPARWRSLTWKNPGPYSSEEICADELEAALRRERSRQDETIRSVRLSLLGIVDVYVQSDDRRGVTVLINNILSPLEAP